MGADASGEDLELTVLMPCLNEAGTLRQCIQKAQTFFQRTGVRGEVLVADNGRTDSSQEIARNAGARLVDVSERGYGAALIGGMNAARGRYVVVGDADDSYDFLNLDAFVAQLRNGADLVIGNRFKGGIRQGAMPLLHRYLGNPVLSFLGRLYFKIPVGDFHCGLRGYRRASIQNLNLVCTGMEYASEMVVKASLNGLKITEVPTTLSPDGRGRPPHLKTWRDGWRHLRFLLIHSPKWLFALPGATMLLLGLVLTALTIRGPVHINGLELDYHTLIAACFAIIMGIQMLVFSVQARAFAASAGFLPQPWRLRKMIMGLSLERSLQVALLVFLGGLGGVIWSFVYWTNRHFGNIDEMDMLRVLVPSMTAIVVSVQLAASAFLASIFSVPRRDPNAPR